MPRRINRNRDYRTHPYLNERRLVSSRMPTTVQTDHHHNNNELDFMNERNILSNSFRPQQADVPASTVDFPENSGIFSTSPEFYDTNYANLHTYLFFLINIDYRFFIFHSLLFILLYIIYCLYLHIYI